MSVRTEFSAAHDFEELTNLMHPGNSSLLNMSHEASSNFIGAYNLFFTRISSWLSATIQFYFTYEFKFTEATVEGHENQKLSL